MAFIASGIQHIKKIKWNEENEGSTVQRKRDIIAIDIEIGEEWEAIHEWCCKREKRIGVNDFF